jgi:hypothetical protein
MVVGAVNACGKSQVFECIYKVAFSFVNECWLPKTLVSAVLLLKIESQLLLLRDFDNLIHIRWCSNTYEVVV